MPTLLVALGGAIGSVARYWMGASIQSWTGGAFPVGTIAVNILGSFVLGVVMALALERGSISVHGRALLAIGFCGGFTTMSTFSYETLALIETGRVGSALGNIGVTLIGCVLGTWLGVSVGRAV